MDQVPADMPNRVNNSACGRNQVYNVSVIDVQEHSANTKTAGKSSLNAVDLSRPTTQHHGHFRLSLSANSSTPIGHKTKCKVLPLLRPLYVLLENLTVEPCLFLFAFAVSMCLSPSVFQNMVKTKVCLTTLDYPKNVCEQLGDTTVVINETIVNQVNENTASHMWYNTLLSTLPATLVILFIGPWTDTNGRKLPLVLACLGSWATMVSHILNVYFMTELDIHFLLLASSFFGLLGGCIGVAFGALTYIIDHTSVERRTVRIGYAHGAMLCGGLLGIYLGIYMKDRSGYIPVFWVGALMNVICLVYIACVLKNDTKSQENRLYQRIGALLNFRRVVEAMRSCFQKRDNHHRMHLLLLMVILTVYAFSLLGEMYAAMDYVQRHFEWTDTTLGFYQLAVILFQILGFFVALPLLVKIQLSDAMIAIVGACTKVCSDLVSVLSPEGWALFAASPTIIFSGLNIAVIHSMISKRVEPHEQGKIMSVASAIEVSFPVIGLAVYMNLMETTKNVLPGSFYIVSASLFLMSAILMTVIWWDTRKQQSNSITITPCPPEHEMNSTGASQSKN